MRTGGLFAVVLLASCGGGDKFTPATPPASICALLTSDDVATLLPGATGGEYPISFTSDRWTGDCIWFPTQSAIPMLELAAYGATTLQGLVGLRPPDDPVSVRTPVTGLGAAAQYWEQGGTANGLWALEGSTSINLTAYLFTPSLTEAQLHPLVAKVLGQLR